MEGSKSNINDETCTIHDYIKKVICEIAVEQNFVDYKLSFKNYVFTGDNYLGDIIRVGIQGKIENGEDKTLHLIIKKAIDSDVTRATIPVSLFYNKEIIAYSTILPTLDKLQEDSHIPHDERFKFAKVYKSNREDRKEFIVMQDLTYNGFTIVDKRNPFSYEYTVFVLENMARFHATSLVLKYKNPELFTDFLSVVGVKSDMNDPLVKLMKEVIKNVLDSVSDPIRKTKVENIYNNVKTLLDDILDSKQCEPFNVICHGDPWNNNMLFKHTTDGKIVETILVDWQIIRSASPVTDISYMLSLSADQRVIKENLPQLLELYYSTLQKNVTRMGCSIDSCYPKTVFKDHIKKYMQFGMLMAFIAIPFMLSKSGEERNFETAFNKGLVVSDEIISHILNIVDLMIDKDFI